MEIGELYFWTATIHKWNKLLLSDLYKDVIIDSLDYLSNKNLIDIYAFVIMPTHMHAIWKSRNLNGFEKVEASLLKYTAHLFRNMTEKEGKLHCYRVEASNKRHEFWQRDSLAIRLYSRKIAFQKLRYIHFNPLAGHWQLARDPCDYKYSSARFYELNIKDFLFLKDIREVI